ncbi:UNVERIFIED_CONTAM: hypothetical protein PYX00_001886 [Menopon gallinae]|uniref:Cytochrome P450 n=1 Tax=Menopon gallinae TaxID=328185 RepID=A0AAW2IE77_9NEOP
MGVFFDSILSDAVAIFTIVLMWLYYYLTSTYSFWESRNIPYIKPQIFFGNLKDIITMKTPQCLKFNEFYNHFKGSGLSYGGIFELRKPVLLVCSPDLIKDMTVKNFAMFHDRGLEFDAEGDPLSANLLSLTGSTWKYIRSKLIPAFSTAKLNAMVTSFGEVAEPYLEHWRTIAKTGEAIDVREMTAQYTTDVIGMCAFGLQLNSLGGNSNFRVMGRKILEPSTKVKILQIINNVYPWFSKIIKFRLVPSEITDYFIGVLRETMNYRKENKIDKNDFLNYLMKIKETKAANLAEVDEMKGVVGYNTSTGDNNIELTENVIAAQAMIFFLAGFETTSTTLSYCMYELALNPDIQKKMKEEIRKHLKIHKEINIEFLHDLTYSEQVIEETMRKHTAVSLILRACTKPYKLPDSETVLPEGTRIFIPVHSLHHDPEYFPDPEKFDPERFSPENREKIIPYSYLPFGEGPRMCIGKRFAMLEMKTFIAKLLLHFTVVPCEKTKPVQISPKTFLLSPVDIIWLKLVADNPSGAGDA